MPTSEPFKVLIESLQRCSRLDSNVLINGEVGTGRKQCALSIHKASRRSNNRFVTVNCTALSENRFDVELFGMQNSAFEMVRKGAIFLAEEGTLYLHEVAELSLAMQAQLVRYIESGMFTPVGSNDVIASDVRIVCSTSANLMGLVEAGRFRNDLYHMLAQMVINTPTLNERIADIDLLAANILREIAPGQPYQLDRSAYNRLLAHSFTGNLIELRNILLRAISQSNSYVIDENVMRFALTGGSMFSQSSDLQDATLSIESSMDESQQERLFISDNTQPAQSKAIAMDGDPIVEPNEVNDSRRKGRWSGAADVAVDEETLDSKLNEFSAPHQTLDDLNQSTEAHVSIDAVVQREVKPSPAAVSHASRPTATSAPQRESLSLKERELLVIEELLEKHGGDKQAVAEELGCTVRTLYRKIEKIKAKSR